MYFFWSNAWMQLWLYTWSWLKDLHCVTVYFYGQVFFFIQMPNPVPSENCRYISSWNTQLNSKKLSKVTEILLPLMVSMPAYTVGFPLLRLVLSPLYNWEEWHFICWAERIKKKKKKKKKLKLKNPTVQPAFPETMSQILRNLTLKTTHCF